jgi:hypothetical protein
VRIQEIKWGGGVTEPGDEYKYFMERRMRIMNLVHVFVCKRIISAVNRFDYVTDRIGGN